MVCIVACLACIFVWVGVCWWWCREPLLAMSPCGARFVSWCAVCLLNESQITASSLWWGLCCFFELKVVPVPCVLALRVFVWGWCVWCGLFLLGLGFSRVLNFFFFVESLILAQDERWRRA